MIAKINNDIMTAMKSHDKNRLETLKLIKSELVKKAKETGAESLSDDVSLKVIQKIASQHKDSIEQFSKANRMDLVEKEKAELDIINEYLPETPSEDKIISVIDKTISLLKETQETISMKDMKTIIGMVQPNFPGVQVGKLISERIKLFM